MARRTPAPVRLRNAGARLKLGGAERAGMTMAVFDLFKRLVSQNTTGAERRVDERLRTTLGARVLVVDDSATIRAVLGKMLVQDGYEVLKAADGETAVEMAQSQLPDLIFLDIVLPGISGFAVLRALRRDSRTRSTPIVMMSGNQQATEQFYVQRFGADGFVKKPFGRIEVFHAVRSLVQAGRMPGRVTAPAAGAEIPHDISPEEWAAIPDIAMPDEEHASPASAPLSDAHAAALHMPIAGPASPAAAATPAQPSAAASDRPTALGTTVISGAAVTMAMRPTLAVGVHPLGPRITVRVMRPSTSAAEIPDAAAGTAAERSRDGG